MGSCHVLEVDGDIRIFMISGLSGCEIIAGFEDVRAAYITGDVTVTIQEEIE